MGSATRQPLDVGGLAAILDPSGTATMLPAPAYLDADVLAWERRHLFAGAWVCAGRGADLLSPGARRAAVVGDDTVLVVRGGDGGLRGFFDVCRHRGHELAPCGPVAVQQTIQCPYHGWRYGLDGALVSTPRFEPPAGFDPAEHGLVPVAVEEWHGWVMVGVEPARPTVGGFLAGIERHVAGHEPERLVTVATHRYEIAANWKLIVENYHECLHCPHLHPELCRVSPPASGVNHGGHDGLWVGGWLALAAGADTMSLDGRSTAAVLRRVTGPARRRVDYLGVLPNLLVSLHPDYVLTHRLEPLAPDRTAIECEWLYAPEAAGAAGFDPSSAVDFWDLTNRQDWAACEAVQRGVASRGFRPGPLSRREDAVARFVRLVARAYQAGGWTTGRAAASADPGHRAPEDVTA